MLTIESDTLYLEKEIDGKLKKIELTEEELAEIGETYLLESAENMVYAHIKSMTSEEQERFRMLIRSEDIYDRLVYLVEQKRAELLDRTASMLIEAAVATMLSRQEGENETI